VRFTSPPKLPISIVPPPQVILPGILGAPPKIRRLVLGTLASEPKRAFRPNGFGEMRQALDEICPDGACAKKSVTQAMREALDEVCLEGACARRSVARALKRPPEGNELQPKIDDYIARSARVVRAILAERGEDNKDFLNWAKDRAKFLVTHNEPYVPPTYEDFMVHRELYS